MLEFNQLKELMAIVVKADRSAPVAYSFNDESFSYDQLQDTLRKEMNELAGSYSLYRDNMNTVFALMEQVLDEYLPKKVLEEYGRFAEVKTFAQGTKPIFKKRTGKMRAKQFITKVGLAGIYEVFKLGQTTFEVETSAIGGAAQIGLEEFLDGRVDFAELTQIVMDGMNELVYREIAKALIAATSETTAGGNTVNHVSANNFVATEFDRLLSTATAYGVPTIYCTHEFATKMLPEETWVSDAMKDEMWANGYFTRYKGYPVIILPQSFEDETNVTKVIDPSYCWIIPTGGEDKPVKVAFEGETIVDEFKNADRSREIQVYKKVGVVVMMTNSIFSYRNTALTLTNTVGKVD